MYNDEGKYHPSFQEQFPDHTHHCLAHARSYDKGLPKERIIHNSWRNTIPDKCLTPTFYKLSLGRCRVVWFIVIQKFLWSKLLGYTTYYAHQDSLTVAETWAFCIGITCCNEIHRSVGIPTSGYVLPMQSLLEAKSFVVHHVRADFWLHFQKTFSMRTTRCWEWLFARCDSPFLVSCFSNVGVHVWFYINLSYR